MSPKGTCHCDKKATGVSLKGSYPGTGGLKAVHEVTSEHAIDHFLVDAALLINLLKLMDLIKSNLRRFILLFLLLPGRQRAVGDPRQEEPIHPSFSQRLQPRRSLLKRFKEMPEILSLTSSALF